MPYKNSADRVAYMKKYFQDHREYFKKAGKKWYDKDPENVSKLRKGRMDRLRTEIFASYGNKCACCPETNREFLTIDHIEGDGRKHRASLNGSGDGSGGGSFYYWIRRQGFPKDKFRLLCMNCNFSYGMYGYCPHQRIPVISFD